MTESRRDKIKADQREKLKNRAGEIRPLLRTGHTFTIRDVDADVFHLCRFLRMNGALEKLGKVYAEEGSERDYITEWRWNTEYRKYIRDYLEEREELPCGHRKHVYNAREVDGLSCKHCVENGEYPEFSKEEVL